MPYPLFRKNKRHVTLLEVLIAFVLVVMCILPLLAPHVALIKMEREFIHKVNLDHAVNLLYVQTLEQLYLNKISWSDLNQRTFDIDQNMLEAAGVSRAIPFHGTFNFFETKPRFKPKKAAPYSVYLFTLTFHFLPVNSLKSSPEVKAQQDRKYTYQVFVVRDLRGGEVTK